jgi:hypothetical protein
MVRRAIEGFCAENGVKNQNLHRSLQDLVERDVIDKRLLEWADGLRILGNVGAHFSEDIVTKQDASDALDLVEAMLDYVYVFAVKFQQFKARRDAPVVHDCFLSSLPLKSKSVSATRRPTSRDL